MTKTKARTKTTKTRTKPQPKTRSRPAGRTRRTRASKPASTGKRSLTRRILIGTLRGTGRVTFKTVPHGIARGIVRTKNWIDSERARGKFADPDYEPEAGEIPSTSRQKGHRCQSCGGKSGKKFRTIEDLNTHFMRVHAHEKPVKRKKHDGTVLVPRGRKGKFRVIPGGRVAGGGRHRKTSKDRRAERRRTNLAATQRAAFTRTGEKAMADIDFLQKIKQGFTMMEDQPLAYDGDEPVLPLSELKATAAGLERIFSGVAVDAINSWRARIVRAGYPPELTSRLLSQAEELAKVGTGFTNWIVFLVDELGPQIEAARRIHGKPGPSTKSLVS